MEHFHQSFSMPMFLNQACAAWFLEIALVRTSVCVSVCPPPRPLITSGVIWCDIDHVRLVKQVLRLLITSYGTCRQ